MKKSQCHVELNFKEHLLIRRLKRLRKEIIIDFWKPDIDLKPTMTLDSVVEKVIFEYSIRKNNSHFIRKFKDFLRDAVLTARAADYLISIKNPESIIGWVESWHQGKFNGQRHDFCIHTVCEFNTRYLDTQKLNLKSDEYPKNIKAISFPSKAVFLVSSKHKEKEELDGLDVVKFHSTTELEIIIREGLDIVEIRGDFASTKDFITTAIIDKNNPLSAARSYFVGEREDSKRNPISPTKQIIKIDTLKNLIDGSYTKIKSPVPGDKVSAVEMDLQDLKHISEESNPAIQGALKEILKNPYKGSMSFYYHKKRYSFTITKTGGLMFREYIPEEVLTYLIYVIKISGGVNHGKQATQPSPEIH